jgi:hypothetical protein
MGDFDTIMEGIDSITMVDFDTIIMGDIVVNRSLIIKFLLVIIH